MEGNETYDDLGPGLHVLREAEPLKRAGAMAAQMDAELCATLPQADTTLSERSALPPIDITTLTTLQVLACRVARAERIAARTRDRAVDEVGQRLAGTGAGLAVHPTTIRDRAAAVDAARTALVAAERALADHVAKAHAAERAAADAAAPAASVGGTDTSRGATATRAGTPSTSSRGRPFRALGVIVASFGLLLLVLGQGLLPLWAALLIPLAASLWGMRYLEPPRQVDDDADHEEASSLLAEVGATTDELFGARRASRELADRTTLLQALRDRAQEEVRVAERAWHEMAGVDADVADVEAVVKRFDPQHADAALLASETVGVRAAEAVLHQFRQRWLAHWRALGLSTPDPAHGEQAVADLAARLGRPIVLVGTATSLGAELARVAPAAPVVVLHGPTDGEQELS